MFVQGKKRKRHVEAQSAEEKEKKRVYTDTRSRKNLCSLLHCHPLKSTFHKEKKSTSEEEKATKLSLPPIMVVLHCFFDSTPRAISETLSWFELVLSKKKMIVDEKREKRE